MLVRITEKCRMECPHCMVDAHSEGSHMSLETFNETLKFIVKNDFKLVFITGGEPTDHPDILQILNIVKCTNLKPLILSNGMFLEDAELTKQIMKLDIGVQITHDVRFYPKAIKKFKHKNFTYESKLRMISPFGRAKGKDFPELSPRQSPLCFNLRSIARRNASTFREAVMMLRVYGKMCTLSINIDCCWGIYVMF